MAASLYVKQPEPLTRHNFPIWKKDVLRIFEIEGLKPWLETKGQPQPDGKSAMDDFRINQSKSKAAGLLKEYCSKEIESEISHLDDPADIWTYLNTTLQLPSRSYKSFCLAEFHNLKRYPDEELPSFIARFEDCYRKLEAIEETVPEQHRCYKVIQNLDETYDYIARQFENCTDAQFGFKNLKEEIIKEFNRQKLRELTRPESFSTVREVYTKTNVQDSFKPRDINYQRKNKPNRDSRPKPSTSQENTFVTEYIEECFASANKPPPTRIWTLDSASTTHICQNPEFFIDMRAPAHGSIVKMGTTPHEVKGIGMVKFTIRNGLKTETISLKDVIFVPTIHKNLISMYKMDKAGYHAKLDKGFKIFSPKWKYLWSASLRDKFYTLYGTPLKRNISQNQDFNFEFKDANERRVNFNSSTSEKLHQAFAVECNLELWHQRLGHCNYSTIKTMFRRNLVTPNIMLKGKEEKCEACIFGKNTRATYPKLPSIRSKEILELIHTDIWGPAPFISKHGYRYILTFLDDYSRRIFCYPLRTKDEVFLKLKNFINFVERQTNKRIKIIRSDNGLEYCSRQVQQLLSQLGIRHEKTNTYSAQQNGSAERVNRLLLEGTRTLLYSANLPQELWLEALQTTAYLRNRTLHSSINDIPFIRWYGRKPTLKHLKRYGCQAYIHVPQQKRNKFEPRAKRGIFVGYSSNTLGYKIWIPEDGTITETKHVTFNESQLGKDQMIKISLNDSFDDMGSTDYVNEPLIDKDKLDTTSEHDFKVDNENETQIQSDNESETKSEPEFNLEPEPDKVTFLRYTCERRSGASKGQIDIYVKTPDGKTLRSKPELINYCNEHNLEYDDSLKIFSQKSKVFNTFKLNKIIVNESLEEANCTDIFIPRNLREAKSSIDHDKWKQAMDREIDNMLKRNVWTPVPKPPNSTVIGTRWVYTIKNKDKNVKHKARLVALGNRQKAGQDYNETYSPVVNFVLIRLFIAIFICTLNWKHGLLDVKSAYLYGTVDKEIYISQPIDYEIPGKENYVLKLNKALYGLHQAGRCWYEELHNKLISNDFKEMKGITCVYSYKNSAVVMVYVDDLAVFARNQQTLDQVIKILEQLYEVENMGPLKTLLGTNFNIQDQGIHIACPKYIDECMKRFNVFNHTNSSLPLQPGTLTSFQEQPQTKEAKETMESVPYRNLLGSLLYVSGRCRPDISFSVASLSQVAENPAPVHWKRLVQVLQYLNSSKHLGLWMPKVQNGQLQQVTYCDASWASDPDTRRSWTGYAIFINQSPILWRIKKQSCIAASPMEAEYIAASEAAKDSKFISMCINYVFDALNLKNITLMKPLFFCDNTATIQFCKHEAENVKNRHIDLKFKLVRELYSNGYFDILHVKSKENIADLLTKILPKANFISLRNMYLRPIHNNPC